MAPTQLSTIINAAKRFVLETDIDLGDNSSRDESSSEDSASEFDKLSNEKLLAIILGSILGIFIILGLVWLSIHIHRRRLARRAQSASFQKLKDVDSRNQSQEDIELGPPVPAPRRSGDRRRNSH
ncbi:hypothetical protein F4821DRAFT_263257 [Hypoxylon rubiginosum]|uniref:Uncharacterized protein n=1 Tax=Hypoxylon rubiginosum TaxID=110542 RepID=A0ACC0CRS8_9PEZI|nr:hypothetical protein F4821DRAFT_263257 [Hypoxylon rubiginosum]